jgi:hypothetical protein
MDNFLMVEIPEVMPEKDFWNNEARSLFLN